MSALGSRSRQNRFQKCWFNDLLALAPEVDKIDPRDVNLMTFWPWLQKSRKSIPEVLIEWFSGLGSSNRQNRYQKCWFNDFLALIQEVDKIDVRNVDLMSFWHWLQKSTKSKPEVLIWWLVGLGSRSRPNRSQKCWFDDSLALAPEVDKIDPRNVDLMTFWHWLQKSTKSIPEVLIYKLSGLGSRIRQNRSQKISFLNSFCYFIFENIENHCFSYVSVDSQ